MNPIFRKLLIIATLLILGIQFVYISSFFGTDRNLQTGFANGERTHSKNWPLAIYESKGFEIHISGPAMAGIIGVIGECCVFYLLRFIGDLPKKVSGPKYKAPRKISKAKKFKLQNLASRKSETCEILTEKRSSVDELDETESPNSKLDFWEDAWSHLQEAKKSIRAGYKDCDSKEFDEHFEKKEQDFLKAKEVDLTIS